VTCLSLKDGLLDENTHAVMPDDLNGLWVDSSRGLYWLNRSEIDQFADGKIKQVNAIAYDGAEVTKTADKTMRQERVACKTADGRIWFPSEKGVVVIDPAHVPGDLRPPVVHIERVLANRKRFDARDAVVAPGEGELEFHFTAATFVAPQKTKFRYQLKGYDDHWVDAEDRRVAFYTNLKPGAYVFQVTAKNADGVWSDATESVSVRLQPHFYQTIWFRLLCGALGIAAVGGTVNYRIAKTNRKQRALSEARDALEAQVRLRTAELARVNDSLQDEILEHKQTEAELKVRTAALEREIEERKQMQAEIERVHRALLDASRQAGMAEIATNVLHNVGNVLTSVNVSTGVVLNSTKRSSIKGVARVAALLRENEADIGTFMTSDPRGKRVVDYLGQLAQQLGAEQATAVQELDELQSNIEHINQIVAMQQSYATISGMTEVVDLRDVVEDSLRMNIEALRRHGVTLEREFDELPPVNTEKHKILQILVNLVRNAKYACVESGRADRRVVVRMVKAGDSVRISVIDNGVGIPAENLTRIFQHGFTTRKDGHGFGLHSGAIAAKNLGGTLTAQSDGPGKGATFTLELPLRLTSGSTPSKITEPSVSDSAMVAAADI
jgi:signal transduction histidine kinase